MVIASCRVVSFPCSESCSVSNTESNLSGGVIALRLSSVHARRAWCPWSLLLSAEGQRSLQEQHWMLPELLKKKVLQHNTSPSAILMKRFVKRSLWIYLCEAPIRGEESPYFDIFSVKSVKQRFDSALGNIRVQHLTSWKNLSLNPCRKFSVLCCFVWKTIESWSKLIAILRRQFCIILTALKESIFSVLGSVASRLRLIRNIFSFK